MTVLDIETEVTVSTRRRLPNRREHELIDFEHGGIRYTAVIGRFNDGALAEIFLNTGKHGTVVDTNARDAAVGASLLLQDGCSVDTRRWARTRHIPAARRDQSPKGRRRGWAAGDWLQGRCPQRQDRG